MSKVCGVREKNKRERGNTPKHTKRRRGNAAHAPKRSTGPHAVHGQKTDTITRRKGNPKTSKKETQKHPKEGKPKNA